MPEGDSLRFEKDLPVSETGEKIRADKPGAPLDRETIRMLEKKIAAAVASTGENSDPMDKEDALMLEAAGVSLTKNSFDVPVTQFGSIEASIQKAPEQVKVDFHQQLAEALSDWSSQHPDEKIFFSVDGNYTNAIDYYVHILSMRGLTGQITKQDVDSEIANRHDQWEQTWPVVLPCLEAANSFFQAHGLPQIDFSTADIHLVDSKISKHVHGHDAEVSPAYRYVGKKDIVLTENALVNPEDSKVAIIHESSHIAREQGGLFESQADSTEIEEGFTHLTAMAILKEAHMSEALNRASYHYEPETWVTQLVCNTLNLDVFSTSHAQLRAALQDKYPDHKSKDVYDEISRDIRELTLAFVTANTLIDLYDGLDLPEEKVESFTKPVRDKQAEIQAKW